MQQHESGGTFVLHEGDGRRVLSGQSDDGQIRTEVTRAK